ncbi:SpoIIE family protein phosphatase [Geodermatophilus sp. DSM 45219]|uniref:SpoIIE family protein phosphatase n=1 Tax=Geodermatophilus sp. DSM 45219 TaxID=1881103 RepID=UPI00088C4D13|nr:SpoIIE family protein phosphatase [Geodermatophilus sp. DSM 45219]SDO06609.1 PAS domain S-box-containing protein [Geodermatophilus sp. DSM 45219]
MTDDDLRRSLFAGGGEVGRAMAAVDWARTPLGPPERWPTALRHTVRVMLTSRFAMWAGWGPDLFFFYNDAYRHDTLQDKHPWALGRPASEVWAEIWSAIAPRVEAVLGSGLATWDEDLLLFLERSGYPEETYHTFSYSPLPGDDGGTGGLFCVVTETTQQVLGERRMGTLRDLAAALGAARTEAGVLAATGEQLARNPADLPFSAVYLVDDDGTTRLGCAAGFEPGVTVLPPVLTPDGPGGDLLQRLLAGEDVLVDDLDRRRPGLPTGAWDRPLQQAVALPIASVAQDRDPVAGFLVVGLNPHRRYDDAYRGFLGLVANQVSSALANAGSYEAERRRAEALAELDRAKTDFFSNVSHEFRTPLTLIAGPVAELRASPAAQSDPRLAEELEVVERNAQRLARLVNTLLDFSRIQAGRIDARFEPVDLAATTAELASVFRSAVVRAGLDFTVDCPPLDEPVHIDRDMWEKVVLNLLSNALKFTFDGGIAVRLRRDGHVVRLTVSDTGTGIPADELPRLFERFHRVADARGRSGEGSGIGLAMVRELVALHGGTVGAESTLGAGTAFTVTLPLGTAHLPADRLAEPAADAPAVSPAAAPFVTEALRWLPDGRPAAGGAVAPGPAAASGRVLVADDNADMRGYLVRLLSPHYDVRAAADGRQALDAVLADPPDLVVSDVMMPGLDGMGLLARLRADPRTARLPVVLLSARAGEEAAVEGLAAGADDYLVKPFSAQELLARVGAHLELGRARRAAEEQFTAMADLAPALIWVAGPDGQRVFVNRGWTEFTGRPAREEVGRGWEQGLHPEDRDRYAEVVAAATARREGWEVDVRLRRADGTYHWLLERAVPIGTGPVGPGETSAGYVGSCTDINARTRETARQTLLAEVGTALDRETTVDGQLGALARLLVERRLADLCSVRFLGDDGRLRFAGIAGLDAAAEAAMASLDPHSGLSLQVLETGESVLGERLSWPAPSEEDATGWPLAMLSAIAVPLAVRGVLRAVLVLGRHREAPPYDDDDRVLLEEVAGRAALAVDNAVLLAEERGAARRLALLQRATAELSSATTPLEVAEVTGGHVRALTGPDSRVAVYELDPSHRALTALAIDGGSPAGLDVWRTVPMSAPLVATTAVSERRPVWVEDVRTQPPADRELAPELAASAADFGLAAVAALPLTAAGRVVGVLSVAWPRVQRFSATDRAMLLAVAEQAASALDRARLYRAERGIAETLQLSLLPAQLPALQRLALAAHYLPGAEGSQAGGDWYDVVELAGSRVAIAVGDVVGQGPAAAAVMGQLRSALSAALLQGCGPAEALELLDLFAGRLPGALASTAACLVLDGTAGTVTWARAGHPPAVLVTPDGAELLDGAGSGTVLGVPGRRPYTEGTAAITPGATLLLYTDGLVERRGEVIDDGLARVCAAAARHAATDPAGLTASLLAEVLADADQPDDVALIAARLLPGPLAARLPADPRRLSGVRRAVTAWTAAAGLSEDTTEDLQLALGEALANAVEHAYAAAPGEGWCSYRVAREPDGSVRVEVRDTGVWRPPPADRGYRGRGLELISALATDVEIGRGPDGDGTTVCFRMAPAVPGLQTRRQRGTPGVAADGGATLAVHDEPGGLRLEVHGEVDLASAGQVRAQLLVRLDRLTAGSVATLDLTSTGYLASAGVGLVLEAVARARQAGVELRVRTEPGTPPGRILALAGVAPDPVAGAADHGPATGAPAVPSA